MLSEDKNVRVDNRDLLYQKYKTLQDLSVIFTVMLESSFLNLFVKIIPLMR